MEKESYCGANCSACPTNRSCGGCRATEGSPFGGACFAADYIKAGGVQAYSDFKEALLKEVNCLLRANGIPEASGLCELVGKYVNLAYTLPSGQTVQFLRDRNIYLGTQIEFADVGICYGVVADAGFILVCSYSRDGSMPEIVAYKKR